VEPERLGLRQRWSTATEWGSAPSPALSDCPDEFDRLIARLPRDLAGIRPLVPQLPPPGEDGAFAAAAVQATVVD